MSNIITVVSENKKFTVFIENNKHLNKENTSSVYLVEWELTLFYDEPLNPVCPKIGDCRSK